MEFPVKTGAPASQKTACAILPVFEGRGLKGPTKEVDLSGGGLLGQLVKGGRPEIVFSPGAVARVSLATEAYGLAVGGRQPLPSSTGASSDPPAGSAFRSSSGF